jgi:peptide/nickel transport system ATP-binding protein
MSGPLLEVSELTIGMARASRGRPVVDEVTLAMSQGDTLGIAGESGCGKTTLGQALLGEVGRGLTRRHGSVRLLGRDVFTLSARQLSDLRGRTISYVPQNAGTALTPTRRIGDLLDEMLLRDFSSRRERNKRSVALLERVRVTPADVMLSRFPHQLSGGQRQRCLIALALALAPQMIVLDEPTTGLDAATRGEIIGLLQSLQREAGLTIVCISHDIRLLSRLCARLSVLYAGQIVEDAPTAAVLAAPAHPYTRALLAAQVRLGADTLPAALPGLPPTPYERVEGCAFRPRCNVAVERCAEAPRLSRRGAATVRCHLSNVSRGAELTRTLERAPPGEAATPILTVTGLTTSYAVSKRGFGLWAERRPSLQEVGLHVNHGHTLGVIGESGSGKSTLLRTLAGLVRAERGRITLDGRHDLTCPLGRRPLDLCRRVQLIWQSPLAALNPRQTTLEALAAPLALYFGLAGTEVRHRAEALLDAVRLPSSYLDRYPQQLSGGEAQRVCIARALAAEPDVLMCDEVTSALDVSVQAAILTLIETLRRERGCSILFVSHDLGVVSVMAHYIVVLKDGRVCEQGTVGDILERPQHPYTRRLVAAFRGESGVPSLPVAANAR